VGIGCRRGISGQAVHDAVQETLSESGIDREEVRVYATTEKKSHERGLFEGIDLLGGVLVLLDEKTMEAHAAQAARRHIASGSRPSLNLPRLPHRYQRCL